MNVENENTEPATGLGLASGYSDRCIQTRLNNSNSGAGANAVDMKFAVTDTLSELVWSPQNGLSLRCADSSFNKTTKSAPFWSARPTDIALTTNSDDPLIGNDMSMGQSGFHINLQATAGETSGRNKHDKPADKCFQGLGGYVEETKTAPSLSIQCVDEKDYSMDFTMKATYCPNTVQAAEVADIGGAKFQQLLDDPEAGRPLTRPLSENQPSRIEFATAPDVPPKNESAANSEEKDEDKIKETDPLNVSPSERLESMAENDLPTPADGDAHGTAGQILAAEFLQEGNSSHQVEGTDGPPGHSPTSSGTHRYHRKGKEKAFSDGDIDERINEENDDSYESMESCNSAGLFSKGKKRSNFEQQLMLGSKRFKTQTLQSPGSASKIKQDSSFMNWISNMVTGFWKSNEEDEAPSQALTVTDANNSRLIPDQNFSTCCREQDYGCRSMGFQSIFHSIFCAKRRSQEAPTFCDRHQTEAELPDKVVDSSATRLSCGGQNPNYEKQVFIANEKHGELITGNEVTPTTEPKVSSLKVDSTHANKTNFLENKHSCDMENHKEKGGTSALSEAPFNGEATQNFRNRDDCLGSLWITRFSPRGSTLLNKESCKISAGAALECSNSCVKPVPLRGIKIQEAMQHSPVDPATFRAKDLQKMSMENQVSASVGVSRINGNDGQKLLHNLNPIISSLRLKSSEAMASQFARRLDAIKHIMPSGVGENATGSMSGTCFYCGRNGDHLQDCSELNHSAATYPNVIPHTARLEEKQSTKSQIHRAGSRTVYDGQHSGFETNVTFRRTFKEITAADELKSTEDLVKKFAASSSVVKDFKEILDAPKGISDAVRALRLSRTNILKVMNSKMSMTRLEGFFLRLRLGKWGEGLGGTGYYVACITGPAEEQSSPGNSKNSISVTVGGVKCLVGPQYISNHDFLEDELKAWWRSTVRNGGGVPSEEDLRQKAKERSMLGF